MIGDRKISFIPYGSFEQMSTEQVCAALGEIGYDAVEWTQFFANPFTHHQSELERLVSVPRAFGLEVTEVIVQKDFVVRSEDEFQYNAAGGKNDPVWRMNQQTHLSLRIAQQ